MLESIARALKPLAALLVVVEDGLTSLARIEARPPSMPAPKSTAFGASLQAMTDRNRLEPP